MKKNKKLKLKEKGLLIKGKTKERIKKYKIIKVLLCLSKLLKI